MDRQAEHEWHVAINRHHDTPEGRADWKKWMYEAKTMSQEVPRLALLFKMERAGELRQTHRQCSHTEAVPVPENHLTCCLGTKTRACVALLAIEAMKGTPEQIDEAKAWTCATHIAFKGGDVAAEGYLMTVDDRMFWDGVYSNMAAPNPDGDE